MVQFILEVNGSSLGLLLTTELKVLAPFKCLLVFVPTFCALQSQHNLPGGLGLNDKSELLLASSTLINIYPQTN